NATTFAPSRARRSSRFACRSRGHGQGPSFSTLCSSIATTTTSADGLSAAARTTASYTPVSREATDSGANHRPMAITRAAASPPGSHEYLASFAATEPLPLPKNCRSIDEWPRTDLQGASQRRSGGGRLCDRRTQVSCKFAAESALLDEPRSEARCCPFDRRSSAALHADYRAWPKPARSSSAINATTSVCSGRGFGLHAARGI